MGLLSVCLLVFYRDTVLYLAGLWTDWEEGGYSHGFVVLLLSGYMVFRSRAALARMAPCPSAWGLPVVALCVLAWMLAWMADIQLVQVAILLPLVMSVLWTVLGARLALKLFLPVLFVGLALPVWDPLVPVLQYITAESAYWLARVFGIPVFMQDFTLHLPFGRLSIEAACSGLHYLLAGVTLGIFYAWLNYRKFRHRLIVVMVAAGASILVNILRVFVVTWLAYTTEMQHPYIDDHLSLGWYLFGGMVFILLMVDLLLTGRGSDNVAESAIPDVAVCNQTGCRHYGILLLTTALVACGPLAASWVAGHAQYRDIAVMTLPEGQAGWHGPLTVRDDWKPQYRGAVSATAAYRNSTATVFLFVGFYPRQSQGVELINDLNRIANDDLWKVRSSVIINPAQDLPGVIEAELDSINADKRLVWYRYRVAGYYTTSAYTAKALQVWGMLTGRPGSAVVAVATVVEQDVAGCARAFVGLYTVDG